MFTLNRYRIKAMKYCAYFVSFYFLVYSVVLLFDSSSMSSNVSTSCRHIFRMNYIAPRPVKRNFKVIYTPNMYVARSFKGFGMCFIQDCVLTNKSSRAATADGIVVNPYSILRKSARFYWNIPKTPKQYWIFVTDESPLNEANKYYDNRIIERFEPLNGLINFTISYRQDSDADFSYGRMFFRKRPVTGYTVSKKNYAAGRKKLAVAFISHCDTTSKRQDYLNILQKFIPIDIIGRCGKLDITCPKTSGAKIECFRRKQYEYKFVIGFENSICKDYITEKTFTWLSYDIVPIVMGGGNYSRDAPPKSLINAFDFDSIQALANYIKRLDQNDHLYNEYFQWKSKYMIEYGVFSFTLCNVCSLLHNPTQPFKVYNNFTKWWVHDANCAIGGWKTRLKELYPKTNY